MTCTQLSPSTMSVTGGTFAPDDEPGICRRAIVTGSLLFGPRTFDARYSEPPLPRPSASLRPSSFPRPAERRPRNAQLMAPSLDGLPIIDAHREVVDFVRACVACGIPTECTVVEREGVHVPRTRKLATELGASCRVRPYFPA